MSLKREVSLRGGSHAPIKVKLDYPNKMTTVQRRPQDESIAIVHGKRLDNVWPLLYGRGGKELKCLWWEVCRGRMEGVLHLAAKQAGQESNLVHRTHHSRMLGKVPQEVGVVPDRHVQPERENPA